MTKGKVRLLNLRGWGFLTTPTETSVFFHASDLVGVEFQDLKVGDVLSFQQIPGEKSPVAKNITTTEEISE